MFISKIKFLYVTFMSGAYDFLKEGKEKAGNEVNPIINDIVVPVLAGILFITGALSLFWSFGQMKKGERALAGIIYAIVAMISAAVLAVMTFSAF